MKKEEKGGDTNTILVLFSDGMFFSKEATQNKSQTFERSDSMSATRLIRMG